MPSQCVSMGNAKGVVSPREGHVNRKAEIEGTQAQKPKATRCWKKQGMDSVLEPAEDMCNGRFSKADLVL